MNKVDLSKFKPENGLNRGRSRVIELCWYLTKMAFFLTAFPWPSGIKNIILRSYGAKVGKGVIIKPRVNIHFPWKLNIGNHSWIGEEVFILNFEPIKIGDNVCISQRSFLCGGNHDYKDSAFRYRNAPIIIEDEVWVGAQTFIAPNVKIEKGTVLTAGSIVYDSQPPNLICSGNPCKPKKSRY